MLWLHQLLKRPSQIILKVIRHEEGRITEVRIADIGYGGRLCCIPETHSGKHISLKGRYGIILNKGKICLDEIPCPHIKIGPVEAWIELNCISYNRIIQCNPVIHRHDLIQHLIRLILDHSARCDNISCLLNRYPQTLPLLNGIKPE